jgi:fructokinase
VAIANDANCFALSEATDGAAAGAATVFGVILGTGVGGGLVYRGHVLDGPLGIAGEWGHNPLPWASSEEYPGPRCWCGRAGCMEAWVSGPALVADAARARGHTRTVEEIVAAAEAGDDEARSALARHADRLARGLAHVVNILDPDVIVLGGGLSRLEHLYHELPTLMRPHIFADDPVVDVRPPRWGDASGVRGAAWLVEVL